MNSYNHEPNVNTFLDSHDYYAYFKTDSDVVAIITLSRIFSVNFYIARHLCCMYANNENILSGKSVPTSF